MKNTRVVSVICALLALSAMDVFAKEAVHKEASTGTAAPESISLPPLPAGVTDLPFSDFYTLPVGPKGLEPTAKLQSLNNKRVRIVGHMAHEDDHSRYLHVGQTPHQRGGKSRWYGGRPPGGDHLGLYAAAG